jgi:hypothetical protein
MMPIARKSRHVILEDMRFLSLLLFLSVSGLAAGCAGIAPDSKIIRKPSSNHPIFDSDTKTEFRLEAPFTQLFKNAKVTEDGTAASQKQGATKGPFNELLKMTVQGEEIAIPVRVSVRGNTSVEDCKFKKLTVELSDSPALDRTPFRGMKKFKIGTHCGDSPAGKLTYTKIGRLNSEVAPIQEVLVYRLLAALGIPSMGAGYARVDYFDKGTSKSIVRDAMILESPGAAATRQGLSEVSTPETISEMQTSHFNWDAMTKDQIARAYYFEALIGNDDYGYPMTTTSGGISPIQGPVSSSTPYWNFKIFQTGSTGLQLIPYDFDLAAVVTGSPSKWTPANRSEFDSFVPGLPNDFARMAWMKLQAFRVVFPKKVRDQWAAFYVTERPTLNSIVDRSPLPPSGKAEMKNVFGGFYSALPHYEDTLINLGTTSIYASAAVAADDQCIVPHGIPEGITVKTMGVSGNRTQVRYYDVFHKIVNMDNFQPCPNPGWMETPPRGFGRSLD